MARIAKDDMTTLRTATESKTTAETALYDVQLQAVAYQINNAANCGELRVIFQEILRDDVREELESKGYELKDAGIADAERGTVISWK